MMSRHNGDEPHDLQILFTGNAESMGVETNMWDIAVGDVLQPESCNLQPESCILYPVS
jgi:hypothetical protein